MEGAYLRHRAGNGIGQRGRFIAFRYHDHHERHRRFSLFQVRQRSSGLENVDDDARRQSFRALPRKRAWRCPLRKRAPSFAQQDRIDQQKKLIRQPMLKQRRSQRRATRNNQVRTVLRLDVTDALHEVCPMPSNGPHSRLSERCPPSDSVPPWARSSTTDRSFGGQSPDRSSRRTFE